MTKYLIVGIVIGMFLGGAIFGYAFALGRLTQRIRKERKEAKEESVDDVRGETQFYEPISDEEKIDKIMKQ